MLEKKLPSHIFVFGVICVVVGLSFWIRVSSFVTSTRWHSKSFVGRMPSDNASLLSVLNGKHLVLYYWCGPPTRLFEFQHYLSMQSVIRTLHPDVIFFSFEEYPMTDRHSYNVWLEDLKQTFPFIYFEKLKNREVCRGTTTNRIKAIADEMSKKGGFYVHESTMLTPAVSEIIHLQKVNGLNERTGFGFLMIQKGSTIDGEYDKTLTCQDSWQMMNYSHVYCVNVDMDIHPKDIWESENSFGELARWATYGETSIQRPQPDYSELAPNIAHYVWIGRGQMGFTMYLSLLSVIYVAKVDKVYIHGENPTGPYWDKIKGNKKLQVIYRYPVVNVFGQRVISVAHRADIWRLDIMSKYGGLYLDADVIFMKPLSADIRAYEAVMSLDFSTGGSRTFPDKFQNGVMLGKRGATFWQKYLQTMRNYRDDLWSWNSCVLPYKVKEKYPKSLLVDSRLQVNCPRAKCHPTWWPNYHRWKIHHLSSKRILDWRNDAYGYHFSGYGAPPELRNETLARVTRTMFGEMARYVMGRAGLIADR